VPDPSPSPTLADLRPPPGSDEFPVHRRTITMEVFGRDEHFAVVGTLHDERPWAEGGDGPQHLHVMELGIVVRRADLTIVDAQADMQTFPHVECTAIEPHFSDLVGLSVGRGYTSAVQERFGRERGCSHLEFLARALGPTVIQATTSAAARQTVLGGAYPDGERGLSFLTNTCHVWTPDGPGAQKVALGWRPGRLGYPAPSAAEVARRLAAGEEIA
jgi:Protein of unknown function (DUF2889)